MILAQLSSKHTHYMHDSFSLISVENRVTLVNLIEVWKLPLEKKCNDEIQTASDHLLHIVGSAAALPLRLSQPQAELLKIH